MRLSRTITEANRAELIAAVQAAKPGAWIELIDDPHTGPQRRLMWKLLSGLAERLPIAGEYFDGEAWKCAFLKAMGAKIAFMPALDGEGVVAIGYRSKRLSKSEMSEMIERIYEYGTRHGVSFDR